VAQLIEYNKKFVIVGSQNAIKYKEIFPLIQQDKMWLGSSLSFAKFKVPDYYEERSSRFWVDDKGQKWRSFGNICWFTNLDIAKRHEELILFKTYNPEEYPLYDSYNAINVDKTSDIPMDYYGIMGVPITFLDKYNPEQFEIVGEFNNGSDSELDLAKPIINGVQKYSRIAIRRRQPPIPYTVDEDNPLPMAAEYDNK
jgi:hypothetical protein